MKEIKEAINRWKDIPCSWIGRINTVKITILPKAMYRFNSIPIKLQMEFFMESEHKISKFVWRRKRPWIPKALLRKNGTRVIWILGFRVYYKAKIIIKTVWYWYKNRNTGYWNRIEIPEISPCIYGQLIHDKGGKSTQCWKYRLFNK